MASTLTLMGTRLWPRSFPQRSRKQCSKKRADERREKSMQTLLKRFKTPGDVPAKSLRIGALLLVVAATGWGQIDRGTIQGIVKDPRSLLKKDISTTRCRRT